MFSDILEFLNKPAGKAVATGVVIAFGAIATAAYKVGNDIGNSSAASYKDANAMGLGALSEEAKKATGELRQATQEFSGIAEMKKEHARLLEERSAMQGLLQSEKRRSEDLASEISALKQRFAPLLEKTRTISLRPGKAELIAEGDVSVSLIETSTRGFVLNFNGERKAVQTGDRFTIARNNNATCAVRVDEYSFSADRATISVTC